ncbi:hypoxanthine/guanine phosphoribosyltransferase [Natronococcus wangiae]|uniref:hypoxanthine/guanine phosphoribosyltransferase n=1 Tax=Natronococcus wangiae TaxID=3068275 RepID=UPI00273FE2EC|nr:hypoxanthine/guanine phosphoribosyltransferase [Natronococcus sp. AD5]
MDPNLEPLARSLRAAPIVDRDGYEYFVHGVTDGIPPMEPDVLGTIVDELCERVDFADVDTIVAPEAMGIHHAAALSLETGVPFVVVRKRSYGFPTEVSVHQETGYGESEFFLNGVDAGDRVVVVDDVLSSGNTIEAVCEALESAGAEITDIAVVLRRVDSDREEFSRTVTHLLDVRVEDGELVVAD